MKERRKTKEKNKRKGEQPKHSEERKKEGQKGRNMIFVMMSMVASNIASWRLTVIPKRRKHLSCVTGCIRLSKVDQPCAWQAPAEP